MKLYKMTLQYFETNEKNTYKLSTFLYYVKPSLFHKVFQLIYVTPCKLTELAAILALQAGLDGCGYTSFTEILRGKDAN